MGLECVILNADGAAIFIPDLKLHSKQQPPTRPVTRTAPNPACRSEASAEACEQIPSPSLPRPGALLRFVCYRLTVSKRDFRFGKDEMRHRQYQTG